MGNIGGFVKKQRKLNNLKQEELALYAGVSPKFISQLENGALYAGVSPKFISQLENGKETLKLDKVNQVLAIFDCELGPIKKY